MADAQASPNGEPARQPFALPVDEFVADKRELAPPLLGDDDLPLLPVGGLVFLAGQGGIGKTTLVLDAVLHLASGRDWLGVKCERPLNILLLENEGPREMFRQKLGRKLELWKAERPGELWVQVWRWASFTLLDDDAHKRLGEFCERQEIDLVVGDPLGTLGTTGVGSPEDTREFVSRLRGVGLTETRAFLFLAHFRKEKAIDEIDQLTGAWGNHLDSLLVLKPTLRPSELRLSFPKLRWATTDRKPLILGKISATQGFEALGDEDSPELLERSIIEYLESTSEWHTDSEIAKAVHRRREVVSDCLQVNDQLFRALPGQLCERPKIKFGWQLTQSVPPVPSMGERDEEEQGHLSLVSGAEEWVDE